LTGVREELERQAQALGEAGVGLQRVGVDTHDHHVVAEKVWVLLRERLHLRLAPGREILGVEGEHDDTAPVGAQAPERPGADPIPAGPGKRKIRCPIAHQGAFGDHRRGLLGREACPGDRGRKDQTDSEDHGSHDGRVLSS